MANQEQLEILKQGVKVWNSWRSKNKDAAIELRDANLKGVNLRGINLRRANLWGIKLNSANLRGADLRETNLRTAILSKADLREANLSRADLWRANLSSANLRKANLRRANLHEANLNEANLRVTNLLRADLVGANLRGADLFGAKLSYADLHGADFSKANLGTAEVRKLEEVRRNNEARYKSNSMASVDFERKSIGSKMSRSSANDVYFTAYHPKEGKTKAWHHLLVYAHIFSALENVRKDAHKYHDQTKPLKETTSQLQSAKLLRGTEITIVPFCEGVSFSPKHISLTWKEDFNRANFQFRANKSLSGKTVNGQIIIFVGLLIIGTLKFEMSFHEKEVDVPTEHEENTSMYTKDEIFISYSRKDAEIALAFKTILRATGLNVFIDIDGLRPGQFWKDEILRRIERANVFQMFWSKNYYQSNNCKMEWKHALKQHKGEGYIRPVFWRYPLSPKPPKALSKFNFQYVKLKFIVNRDIGDTDEALFPLIPSIKNDAFESE